MTLVSLAKGKHHMHPSSENMRTRLPGISWASYKRGYKCLPRCHATNLHAVKPGLYKELVAALASIPSHCGRKKRRVDVDDSAEATRGFEMIQEGTR